MLLRRPRPIRLQTPSIGDICCTFGRYVAVTRFAGCYFCKKLCVSVLSGPYQTRLQPFRRFSAAHVRLLRGSTLGSFQLAANLQLSGNLHAFSAHFANRVNSEKIAAYSYRSYALAALLTAAYCLQLKSAT